MNATVLALLLLCGGDYCRVPLPPQADESAAGKVWVFFTDKGIRTDAEYSAALRQLAASSSASRTERRLREPVAGYDFDDLPVRTEYVQNIEALGARLRAVSDWLNAASFDMSPGLLETVRALPFVYDVRPVASQTRREPADLVPLKPSQSRRSRAVDTATAHRFYGPSYDQAEMMGVPELFFQGYFGSGARLAIFDTGLKPGNVAVDNLRIYKQHDFLSEDHLQFAGTRSGWSPSPAEELRYLGLVRSPALNFTSEAGAAFLLFVADSFAYQYSSPRRAVFASTSTDSGNSWSAPVPVVLSQPASRLTSYTFEDLRIAARGPITYLAYTDVASGYRTRPSTSIHVGYFVGPDWHSQSNVGSGRRPDMLTIDDTLYLSYVIADSTFTFRKASIELPQPIWTSSTDIHVAEPLDALELAVAADGRATVVVRSQSAQHLLCYHSTDRGETFSPALELVAADAHQPQLLQNEDRLLLFYKHTAHPPFTRLSLLCSDDFGLTWTSRPPITESTLSIGSYAAAFDTQDAVGLLYETGGLLYHTRSTDLGLTWESAELLDTAGFCYQPALARLGEDVVATWTKRGDDNTVWEPGDTARFSSEQPDHGTRMASIIAGYQQGSIVGIAPGVDLIIAKTELHKTAGGRYYEYDLEEDTYIQALEWAERVGADIVSTSLGYRGWYADDQFDGRTAPISVAASLAAKRGIIVVTAMGNRDTLVYPWPEPYIVAPADADGVIAAGGVERNLLPWRGTGTGPTSDGRAKPELVALSDTVAVVAPDSFNALEGSVGTSCATALIAGCCALVKQAHPDWSADSIKAALFTTATRSTQSCTFGFGVPRVDSVFKVFPPQPGVRPAARDEIWAFPNPFVTSQHDTVRFAIDLTRPGQFASISIFTASGVLVDTIPLEGDLLGQPGTYEDIATLDQVGSFWDGLNLEGNPVSSGLYLAVLNTTYGRAACKFGLVR